MGLGGNLYNLPKQIRWWSPIVTSWVDQVKRDLGVLHPVSLGVLAHEHGCLHDLVNFRGLLVLNIEVLLLIVRCKDSEWAGQRVSRLD